MKMSRQIILVSVVVIVVAGSLLLAGGAVRTQEKPLEERVADLEKDVSALYARVERLEHPKPRAQFVPSHTEQGLSIDKAPWRSLQKGMGKDEIRKVLGEPDRIDQLGTREIWYYTGGGQITLDETGAAVSWSEPK